ncbi:MAG: LemA family protein [Roseibacillus sp.]
MKTFLIVLGVLVVLDLAWFIWAYNKLVVARNQMREGWSGIEVQLKRRHDLVPALVECVRGYQTHERELLEAVTRERTEAQAASGAGEAGGAEQTLGRDLGKIVALAEDYPDLKADESFRGLMTELVEIEDQIQYSRRYYNGSVRDLNNSIETFPTNLVAKFFTFEAGVFFEVENASERLPPDLATALKGG